MSDDGSVATSSSETAWRPPDFDAVRAAAVRIAGTVRQTPFERSDWLSEFAGVPVFLKLECWQRTRSFKLRGASNALLQMDASVLQRGPVTASAGNHGQAVALAAREAGVRATVFVPVSAPRVKQERIRRFGAELRVEGADYDEAEALAVAYAGINGRPFLHAFSDPAVIAGQGTVGVELHTQAPELDLILVPIGGGGLISGVGLALRELRPHTTIVGVQSVETRAMHDAFAAGRAVPVPVTPTLADGLAGCTDQATYAFARTVADRIILVNEDAIARAIRGLYLHDGMVAEGAGAVGVAALLERSAQPSGPVAVIVSGGNIDGGVLSRLLREP